MKAYNHIVQYYETDKMGITHHSNYVRWMEEARVDYLKQIGWDYAKLEEMGLASPVVELNCKYKSMTTFSDSVNIEVKVKEIKGTKLIISYEMKKEDGTLVLEGESKHCFLSRDGKVISIAKEYPDFYNTLLSLVAE